METSIDKCLAFCQTLAMSGQKFTFTLSFGKDSFSFNNKELASSSCAKKKKSPSQIRREKRRREERTVKIAAAKSTEKVAEVNGAEETVNTFDFQCSQCDLHFKAEEELKIHMKDEHTIPNLSTPEKERLPDQTGDLKLTPVHGERSDEVAEDAGKPPSPSPSPPPTLPLVCDLVKYGCIVDPCGQTFSSEEELRVHAHLGGHFTCTRERYSTPCPWEGCISHESKQ